MEVEHSSYEVRMIDRTSVPYKLKSREGHLSPGSFWRALMDVRKDDFWDIIEICLEFKTKSSLKIPFDAQSF